MYTIVGIDFGTSTTVVKVKNYSDGMNKNECQTLVINGSPTIPTLVFEDENGNKFFGTDAKDRAKTDIGVLYQNFKMDTISPDPDKSAKAKELIQDFFNFLYQEFDKQRNFLHVSPELLTHISYPAKWTPDIINFMKQCAVKAGFGSENTVFGDTEPVAAIYAAMVNNSEKMIDDGIIVLNKSINVFMLDMGAGTSDVTIFKFFVDKNKKFYVGYEGKIISYPAIDNPFLCGGREIDDILSKYNEDYLRASIQGEVVNSAISQMHDSMKAWKETSVSPRLSADEEVPMDSSMITSIQFARAGGIVNTVPYRKLNRELFEDITKKHWENLHRMIWDSISKASTIFDDLQGPEDIDLVILTGGHSQWYCVKDIFLGKSIAGLPCLNFKKLKADNGRLIVESRPQETVAAGLTYRDLDFDIKQTAANCLWLKFMIKDTNGHFIESELFNPVHQFSPLPADVNVNWKCTVNAHFFSLNSVLFCCKCYYGTEYETAVQKETFKAVSLNNLASLLAGILILPIAIFDQNFSYEIRTNVQIHVNEDGTVKLNICVGSEYGVEEKYSMYL